MLHTNKYVFLGAFIILLISAFLRFYKLDQLPLTVNQDELSNIYDGYCIAETGADRWGENHPFILRGFGEADNRPPLFGWICAASIKSFGFSIIAGRAPAAFLGVISLLFLFLVARKIGGNTFSLLSLIIGCFSPWHLLYSKMAHEGTMLPAFFIIVTMYLWQKTKENKNSIIYLILLGFTIGLSVNAYQSTKLIFFFLSIFILINIFRDDFPKIKRALIMGSFIVIGAFPQLYMAITRPEFFSNASHNIMPFSWSISYLGSFISNIYANISPKYLFFTFGYNNLSIARLLTVEMAFFYIGLIFFGRILIKSSYIKAVHYYVLVFLAILPAALTVFNPHSLRSSGLIILYPMATAAGVIFIANFIKSIRLKFGFLSIFVFSIVINSGYIVRKYAQNWDFKNSMHQNELVQIGSKINQIKNNYNKIFIQNFENHFQEYIYIASFCNIKPIEFQLMKKIVIKNGAEDKFRQLGKYYFFDKEKITNEIMAEKGKNLIVFNSKVPDYQIVDSLNTPHESFYFYKY